MSLPAGTWLRSAAVWPALCAVLAVALQGTWASRNESQTWDETFALVTGFTQVEQGRLDLLAEWPPLLGLAVYLPLKALDPRLPPVPPVGAEQSVLARFGSTFLYGQGNPHREMLLRARGVVLAFTLMAVFSVVVWAHRLHGSVGAWLAAILCAFEPNWLAHGHLTAWDGIATSTFTLALVATAWTLERPTLPRALALGLLAGLAWSAKFSTLLLLPLSALLLLLASPLAGRWRLRSEEGPLPFGRLCLMAACVAVVGALVVGASYNGSFGLAPFVAGVRNIYGLTRAGYENYLLGEFRTEPFRHYYLVALLVKTPLGFLPLLPLGLVATLRRGSRARLWLPAALALGLVGVATAFDRLNTGVRHAVPAIPAMIVLAAGAPGLLAGARPRRWMMAAVLLLAGLGAVETLARAPHYLSFFNLAVGGPRGGIDVLDASNIDWGQDLVALERVQREEGIEWLALAYHGTADPSAYGVRFRTIPPGELRRPRPGVTYAISIHLLNRMGRQRGGDTDWLRRYEPWRRAGNSILLYRF